MLEKLWTYMGYDFVINALIVGVLIAFCASLLGVTLVLKRFSYKSIALSDKLWYNKFGTKKSKEN